MRNSSKRRATEAGSRAVSVLLVVCALILGLAAHQAAAKPRRANVKVKPTEAAPTPLPPAGEEQAKEGASAEGTRPPGRNAVWACDKDTVELEAVWRGNHQLTFPFDIRNEGTDDLNIKAVGG